MFQIVEYPGGLESRIVTSLHKVCGHAHMDRQGQRKYDARVGQLVIAGNFRDHDVMADVMDCVTSHLDA